jgi:transcriptional regulator with XRE-family HTH domain
MKKGDQKRIAEHTKLSASTVSCYFTGYSNVSQKTRLRITRAIRYLNIDYKVPINLNVPEQLHDRYDIYNNLPYGALASIAKKVGCSNSHVKYVLEGKHKDNYGIIKRAELIAAIHIWKTRFCKYKSKL